MLSPLADALVPPHFHRAAFDAAATAAGLKALLTLEGAGHNALGAVVARGAGPRPMAHGELGCARGPCILMADASIGARVAFPIKRSYAIRARPQVGQDAAAEAAYALFLARCDARL